MKKTSLSFLALLLCVSLCACGTPVGQVNGQDTPDTKAASDSGTVPGSSVKAEPVPAQPFTLKSAENYQAVYSTITEYRNMEETGSNDAAGGVVKSAAEGVRKSVDSVSPAPMADPELSQAQPDYSGTNVQVKGIDEGDIVKTDGKYLYILDQTGIVRIVEAAGADTRQISAISLGENWWGAELYVSGDVLAVVRTSYQQTDTKDGTRTVVEIYDIADRKSPVKKYELGQDGDYLTSRLTDGVLYLISRSYVCYWQDGVPEPRTYIPCIYNGGQEKLIDAGNILLPPHPSDSSYTILAAVDIAAGKRLSEQAVMGCADTVYMNAQDIYLAGSQYEQTAGPERMEKQYKVVDWDNASVTTLTRFSVNGGALKAEATGSIPGSLLNQFSMDEKDGFLRLVTTINQYSYTVYTDEEYGFTNYRDRDALQSNALYVLNADLRVVGSIENLAKDERVYSVRFDGDIGYFVTFRQVDPLFSVDLSDPAAPVILGELKIPGFSQYLHVYGDGLLFGLGRSVTDDESGMTDGMKLSMFDVSDPSNVTEKQMLKLENGWSEALYNHKAILVLPDKNIIAFPMNGNGYTVYGYDAETGFTERAFMEIKDILWDQVRGVQIGDLFYVCASNGVSVCSLTDFSPLAEIRF